MPNPCQSLTLLTLIACLFSAPNLKAQAAPSINLDPKSAVELISSTFTPNEMVRIETTGKPLSKTGTWGAQVNFPGGLPKPCTDAHMPCVRVNYRVPDDHVVCEWEVGFIKISEPQSDGSRKSVEEWVVLDENEQAAHYTLKKTWAADEDMPRAVALTRAEYPQIAREAHAGGVVRVRIIVGPDGRVQSAVPLSGPAVLQPPVVAAMRKWRFEPQTIGTQPISFRLDEQFTYNIAGPDLAADMNPSGVVVLPNDNPRETPGFRRDGAASGSWVSCDTATGCKSASPDVPK